MDVSSTATIVDGLFDIQMAIEDVRYALGGVAFIMFIFLVILVPLGLIFLSDAMNSLSEIHNDLRADIEAGFQKLSKNRIELSLYVLKEYCLCKRDSEALMLMEALEKQLTKKRKKPNVPSNNSTNTTS